MADTVAEFLDRMAQLGRAVPIDVVQRHLHQQELGTPPQELSLPAQQPEIVEPVLQGPPQVELATVVTSPADPRVMFGSFAGTPLPSLGWSTVVSNVEVVLGTTTLADTVIGLVLVQQSAPCTVSLPANPVVGQVLVIKDALGQAATYPITISGGAVLIEGASSLELTVAWSWVRLAWGGTRWLQV